MAGEALSTAMHARMVGDATLIADMLTYRSVPAVFMFRPVPPGIDLKGNPSKAYISVPGPASQSPFDTKNSLGRTVTRDVGAYTHAGGDPRIVDRVAERVMDLFHRHKLVIVGWGTVVADGVGPVEAQTDETVYGRVVSVTLTLERR